MLFEAMEQMGGVAGSRRTDGVRNTRQGACRDRTTNLKHREVMLAQAYAVLLDRMPYNKVRPHTPSCFCVAVGGVAPGLVTLTWRPREARRSGVLSCRLRVRRRDCASAGAVAGWRRRSRSFRFQNRARTQSTLACSGFASGRALPLWPN